MIGHIVLLIGYILQLWLIGKSFAFERDAQSAMIAKRWRRIRFAATVAIPLPELIAFFVWCVEYSLEMAVVLVMMEAIPLVLVLWFILKMIYSVNSSK
ncbi:MAG: hypothetical protein E7616_05035 [Ruminococcaceae bacterium]|nr:hypothetical protein [Oscillospiraceae bacterium]